MATASSPLQVRGEVISLKRVGEYYQMAIAAPGIAERAKPGQFVALTVGGTAIYGLLLALFGAVGWSTAVRTVRQTQPRDLRD